MTFINHLASNMPYCPLKSSELVKWLSEVARRGDKSRVLDHIFIICTETLGSRLCAVFSPLGAGNYHGRQEIQALNYPKTPRERQLCHIS